MNRKEVATDIEHYLSVKSQWILIGIAFVAATVICSVLGRPLYNPFRQLQLKNPTMLSTSGNATAIIDDSRRRVLFLDRDMMLINSVDFDIQALSIDAATDVLVWNDSVYVLGLKRTPDGEGIESESLIKFSILGAYEQTMYTLKNEDTQTDCRLLGMSAQDGNLYLLRTGKDHKTLGATITINCFHGRSTEPTEVMTAYCNQVPLPMDAAYDARTGLLLYLDIDGDICRIDTQRSASEVSSLLPPNSPKAISIDYARGNTFVSVENSLPRVRLITNADTDPTSTRMNQFDIVLGASAANGYVCCVGWDNRVTIRSMADDSQRAFNAVPLAPFVIGGEIAAMVSVLYLVGIVVFALVRAIMHARAGGQNMRIRLVVFAVVSCLVFAGALGYLSYDSFTQALDTRKSEVKLLASYLCEIAPMGLGADASEWNDYLMSSAVEEKEAPSVGTDDTAQLDDHEHALDSGAQDLDRYLQGVVGNASNMGLGLYYNLYSMPSTVDARNVTCLSSSEENVISGRTIWEQSKLDTLTAVTKSIESWRGTGDERAHRWARGMEVLERSDDDSDVLYCIVPLFDADGSCSTLLELGSRADSFAHTQRDRLFGDVVFLALAAVMVYMVADEMTKSAKDVLDARELVKSGQEWGAVMIVRPVYYLLTIASTMDSSLYVVLAKDMIQTDGLTEAAFVLSLPVLASTIGSSVGSLAWSRLGAQRSGRRVAYWSLMLAVSAQVVAIFALSKNVFALFVACKFVSCIGYELGMCAVGDIGHLAQGDYKEEASAATSTRTSAQVVSGVIAGMLVGSFGATWIYGLSAFIGFATLHLVLPAMPRHERLVNADDLASTATVARFFTSRPMMLSFVFAGIPMVLAGGYRTFIFPLFLDTAGVSDSMIAHLFVLGELLVYFAMPILYTLNNHLDAWKQTALGMFGLGVTFALFAVNQTVAWAVLAIVVVDLLSWLGNNWKHFGRTIGKEQFDLTPVQVTPPLNIVNQRLQNLRAPGMTLVLSCGASMGCVILAGIMTAGSALFALTTRGYRPEPKDPQEGP